MHAYAEKTEIERERARERGYWPRALIYQSNAHHASFLLYFSATVDTTKNQRRQRQQQRQWYGTHKKRQQAAARVRVQNMYFMKCCGVVRCSATSAACKAHMQSVHMRGNA